MRRHRQTEIAMKFGKGVFCQQPPFRRLIEGGFGGLQRVVGVGLQVLQIVDQLVAGGLVGFRVRELGLQPIKLILVFRIRLLLATSIVVRDIL